MAAARAAGAEVIAGVDPITLGVLAPPGELGVGIAVGTVQTLGVHLNAGGGVGGFIASRDEERYAREYPTLQVSICDTTEPGERGFGIPLFAQTSYGAREEGNDWTGNSVYLWAIANAAYMARWDRPASPRSAHSIVHSALRRPGSTRFPVSRSAFRGFFGEFVVDFNAAGDRRRHRRGAARARHLRRADLSRDFPELGQAPCTA